MNKIRQYFSTFVLTRGFLIAFLGSAFIYLNYLELSYPFLNTLLAILSLYFILKSDKKIWLVYGFWIGILWFWWIGLSFKHYQLSWLIPFVIVFIGLVYAFIFYSIAYISEKFSTLNSLIIKSLGLLAISYIHPFGFDWLKPELMFIESYIGILKWQFAIILISITLTIWRKNYLYLIIMIFSYQTNTPIKNSISKNIEIANTNISVEDKWNETLHKEQFQNIFQIIDKAIDDNKSLVILPESIFPIFLNHSQEIIDTLREKATKISIVLGGLYWDGKTPRNSTYIFTDGKITLANKVLLVPFGESNPLPDFLSDIINQIFYDGAVDYKASSEIIDYKIDGITYRNAICFEATSEKLYKGNPKNMIVISNNGWFTPSIEPTLQKLLLRYYNKKYGTTIYHSVNMSESYFLSASTSTTRVIIDSKTIIITTLQTLIG